MSRSTAAIEKIIKAKQTEICEYKESVGILKSSGHNSWREKRKPAPEEQSRIDLLEGQLKTFEANLKNTIDAEYKAAMNITPRQPKSESKKAVVTKPTATMPKKQAEPEDEDEDEKEVKERNKDKRTKRTDTIASKLVLLADIVGKWHTPDQIAFITVPMNGHKETYRLRSKAAKTWLSHQYYLETLEKAIADGSKHPEGRVPGADAINDALNVIEGIALFDGKEHPVYVRVAPFGKNVYVDLGRPEWEAIEITADGWQIVSNPPVKFMRPKSMLPLPIPIKGGSWQDFKLLINAYNHTNWVLSIAWLSQAYWPSGPYNILILNGEQGSAKSKMTEYLKNSVDPSTGAVRRPPREERDLMIAAQAERILAFDNLSGLPKELSDALCCMSTGSAMGSRLLYSDGDEHLMSAKRPLVLNGIDQIATRGDLIDRSSILTLQKIPVEMRKEEKELDAKFETYKPNILGLVLDATVTGLKNVGMVKLTELPRMADFAEWVIACEDSLPWEKGEFIEIYNRIARDAVKDMFETDRFAQAVFKLTKNNGKFLSCSASDLLDRLNSLEGVQVGHEPQGWPRAANKIKSRLTRVAPALRAAGCEWKAEVGEEATMYTISVT